MRRYLHCVSWLVLSLATATPGATQTYPTKPVRLVVPYAPGGIADIAARIVGAKLTEAWGQQVVVENKPGGNATIGMSTVAHAAPDGYSLLVATSGDFELSPQLLKDMPYDVARDFAPITSLTDTPTFLGANVDAPYKTLADVIADAKAKPGKIPIASPGTGSMQQLHFEWMASAAGIKLQHIPSKGGAPAAAAVAAGDVPIGLLAVASTMAYLKNGRVRVLAQMPATRSSFIPDVPTMKESGLSDVDGTNWTMLMAPKATPQPIIDKVHAETVRVLALPDVIERFKGAAAVTIPTTPADLARRIARETEAVKVIIAKTGMTSD